MKVAVVIPAGGSGQRMGLNQPKQCLTHNGKSMLEWSLEPFFKLGDRLSSIVVPLPSDMLIQAPAFLKNSRLISLCQGGARRQDSVHAGFEKLLELGHGEDIWLVHDAARPLLSCEDLLQLIGTIEKTREGALLALPVRDTLKRAQQETVVAETIDRSQLWQAQTPQGALGPQLWSASLMAKDKNWAVTDDASLLEQAGVPVHLVEGNPLNFKVTHPQDWEMFKRLC